MSALSWTTRPATRPVNRDANVSTRDRPEASNRFADRFR